MRLSHLLVVLAPLTAWAGCSTDRDSFRDDTAVFADPDGGAAAIPDACSGFVCSRDLHSVLDCVGNMVKECPSDKACGGGDCVAPCDAAAANEGSLGCSFAIPAENVDTQGVGSCAAFFVANTWSSPATLHLEYDGKERALDDAVWMPVIENGKLKHQKLEGPIPPGGGAVVFVSNSPSADPRWIGCPDGVKPVFAEDHALHRTGVGRALFATADVPVSMYSIFPYGGGDSAVPSATLLLPTSSFRTNYLLVSSWGGSADIFGVGQLAGGTGQSSQPGKPTVQIIASEDDTSVSIVPKVDIIGGQGVARGARGKVVTYTLKRGEVLQLLQQNELVGSVLESTKPVGVFGGHSCLNLPGDLIACDVDNEQIPPLSAWGHEYAVVPAPNRASWASQGREVERDPTVVRLVGAVDGTELVYEPAPPAGAPSVLASGQEARFFSSEPFVVRSQDSEHPLYVATMMTGRGTSSTTYGDPETTIVTPTDQWLDTYGFFSDYTYALSAMVVVRRRVGGEFRDVTLDCAGPLAGWKSINADYEWTLAELTRGKNPMAYPAGSCTDGAHRVSSAGPFSMIVWGIDYAASYAYPGGTGLRSITSVRLTTPH
jgi:IgGFc binding protein